MSQRRPCTVEGCDRPHKARGWCMGHYNQWQKHGDPLVRVRRAKGELLNWLLARLQEPFGDECVHGIHFNEHGYAMAGSKLRASHVVLEATGRPRPAAPKNLALHSCDNPPCINPRHLRWGSNSDNAKDMVSRQRSLAGEQNPNARLREADVILIRDLYQSGVTNAELARKFGLTSSKVHMIVTRKEWRRAGDAA